MTFNDAVATMDGNEHRTELKRLSKNELISENRIGRFSIDRRLLLSACEADLRQLFGTLIVVKAETDFVRDTVDYMAFSVIFPSVPPNTKPPEYHIWMQQDHYGGWEFAVEDRTDAWNSAGLSISHFKIEESPMLTAAGNT